MLYCGYGQQTPTKLKQRATKKRIHDASLRVQQAYLNKYPTFIFENEERADPRFVQKVKEIVEAFDFRELPPKLSNWYAAIKKDRNFLLGFMKINGGACLQGSELEFYVLRCWTPNPTRCFLC